MGILIALGFFIFLPLISTTLTLGTNRTAGCTYTGEAGVARAGTPLQTLMVDKAIQCTIECNALYGCDSFNVISLESDLKRFLCQFFKALMRYQDKVVMENSIYYTIFNSLRDCLDICKGLCLVDREADGVHQIHLSSDQIIRAVCDMDTEDGGWTLLQRRFDGTVDFYRDWQSYKNGFGELNGEFWFGLENAHLLMRNTNTTLRFDIWDGTDYHYQEYYNAMISNENDNYRLTFDGTSGTAGDAMTARGKSRMFSTKDRENDEDTSRNCAQKFQGAWWYGDCHHANLNGKYGSRLFGVGLNWFQITGYLSSLSKTEIKVKRHSPIGC